MALACRVRWISGSTLVLAASLLAIGARAADPTNSGGSGTAKPGSKVTVDLFDAVKSGQIAVKFIPRNSLEGQLLVTNQTDQPLTVKLPDAFAAIPVLAQAAANPPGGNGNNKSYNKTNQNQGVGGGGG